MLNQDTKKHIDSARQVLVGVVPNPATQIDQITNALIYKFMDDMDQESIKAGGEASFFTGDLEKYAWTRLMDPRVGNQERMNLYAEALLKFSESKQLPALFRDIFRQAFLPYRSPEVLGLFLKEIAYFDYSHSEELGNAYEYLLSIMSSQGDAGQFRTPRHIIDFMVEVVNPTKDDKVLDPACGTAGFLISAYKHIRDQHDGKSINSPQNTEKPLTPDERKTLMGNFEGYDIDPGMVRISQVNMYLHGFHGPKIYQYDSLSMDDHWNDKFDVILANPPFMSPKGGIRPHSKFSIQSNRSEVLFVDYIMNHLRPRGRAAVIVPEGIIFQSGTAYKQLRKNLVEDGLFSVVSLPSGVFNPYAGVKTSILFFNNEIAKISNNILFIKVRNDGFDLGAQRRKVDGGQLTEAAKLIRNYCRSPHMTQEGITESANNIGTLGPDKQSGVFYEILEASLVAKTKIAETGDYNLSGDRYHIATDYANAKWPIVELGEVTEILKGSAITKKDTKVGNIPVIAGGQEPAYYHNVSNRTGEIITVSASGAYAGYVNYFSSPIFASDCSTIQTKDDSLASTQYLYRILKAKQEDIYEFQQGGGQPHVYPKDLRTLKIPLPPLEIQAQIVAELNGYQKIIDGAKQIVQNWKPKIDIDPRWDKVKLGEVCEIKGGKRVPKGKTLSSDLTEYPYIRVVDFADGTVSLKNLKYISKEIFDLISRYTISAEDVYISIAGTIGLVGTIPQELNNKSLTENAAKLVIKDKSRLSKIYLTKALQGINSQEQIKKLTQGVGVPKLGLERISTIKIPLPSLEIQKQVAGEIEAEHVLVDSAKKLIEIYEQKTKKAISKLWGM